MSRRYSTLVPLAEFPLGLLSMVEQIVLMLADMSAVNLGIFEKNPLQAFAER